jgi:phosphoenolpyruvate synthase/pyruvate phosphate dikinase
MSNSATDTDLSADIRAAFGSDTRMLRFRSSSNAEDALEFSGAGLYDSFSGCLADDLDGDKTGPSACDASEPSEHTVARALVRVWASLWNAEAYDEREWYGIDHERAAMAVLVDPRATGELANIVAFSGNPTAKSDDRYLVDAQAGELAVVLPEPGVFPEENLLTMTNGEVSAIDRARASSQVTAGTWVLQDAQLQQIGSLLWQIVQVYPVDGKVPSGASVILDTEWKILADGSLVVKQVRPFLRR